MSNVPYPMIYLCGPIHGRTDEECVGWRQRFAAEWPGECLDPMRRDYRGREHENPQELVKADLEDVSTAGALVVYFDKPSVGTSMEIFYARHCLDKPVVVINASDMSVLPVWLVYHSTVIVRTLEEAVSYLSGYAVNSALTRAR
jgi:nucleoside 2-deoxyribosyltransferase